MTNSSELRSIIKESGLKYQFIAKKLNITPHGLKKKIDNESEFKASEISTLCEVLNITDLNARERIFFKRELINNLQDKTA